MTPHLIPPSGPHDHHIGPLYARAVLVEYGDYECPYTARADAVVRRLLSDFKTDLCFVYRHYPLRNIHAYAEHAAVAAEAADLQRQFWPMHAALLDNQDDLGLDRIFAIARGIGLDVDMFQADMARPELIEKVRANFQCGIRSGVSQTPTFFLNGRLYEHPANYGWLRQSVERAIEHPSVPPPSPGF